MKNLYLNSFKVLGTLTNLVVCSMCLCWHFRMRMFSVQISCVTGWSQSSSAVGISAQNSYSFSDMPLPSLNTSLLFSSFGLTDLLSSFLVLMLLKAYIILISLENCFLGPCWPVLLV